ncbi:hypothetical protein [Microvirga terrestris]|uniref:hypothetical protein n=1 Tax=Microvirga terrestris TaxID=2791024 RepID=UPI001AEDF4FE|nr:hypothetical protein [Microvirga terrestris]
MMKSHYIMPLLMMVGLSVASEANALALDNGRNLNGRNLNGLSTNGLSTNGLSTNGLSTNGLSTNGRNLNGVVINDTAREEAKGHATTIILRDGERVILK